MMRKVMNMPVISKIRLTNVIYEDGGKRFNDELFRLDGHNSAFILENGGGKTVLIHTVLQAILPHTHLGERKIKETLQLDNAPAHIGIEWVYNDRPRRYVTTAISLFLQNNQLHSHKYVYEYEEGNKNSLEQMPFSRKTNEKERPATRDEISDYYSMMKQQSRYAHTFDTISSFHDFIERNYDIVKNEWESIVKINRDEGGIEGFFQHCKTTTDLYDRLLIPTVEDSIAGHTKDMFANMFEKQRDVLKAYRNLKNTIKENKKIQIELTKYVAQYEQFSKQKEIYEQIRAQAKGLFILLNNEEQTFHHQQQENDNAWDKWHEQNKQLHIEHHSLEIAKQRVIKNELEHTHINLNTTIDKIMQDRTLKETQYATLQYGELSNVLQTETQLLNDINIKINEQHQTKEVDDLKATLEIENAKLYGYYVSAIDELEKVIKQIEANIRPINHSIATLLTQIENDEQTYKNEQSRLDNLQGQLQSNLQLLNDLAQKLLANPVEQRVKDEFNKWTARVQFLDEDIIQLQHIIREANKKIKALENKQLETREKIDEVNLTLNKHKHIINDQQHAHETLITSLTMINEKWKTVDNLYLKESSLNSEINDSLITLKRVREELLVKERLAYRFIDDYENETVFFSDPYLMERIKVWSNNFYLKTGTEFFTSFTEAEKEIYRSYTLWPLTLITEHSKREELRQRINQIKDRLQYPIIILTIDDIKQINKHNSNDLWIAPKHWETNLDSQSFELWKQDLLEHAKQVRNERIEKEKRISSVEHIQREVTNFFSTYPAKYIEETIESINQLNREKDDLTREVENRHKQIEQLISKVDEHEKNEHEFSNEKNGLERKVEIGNDYFKIEREIVTFRKKHEQSEQTINSLGRNINSLRRQLDEYKATREELIEDKRNGEDEIRFLKRYEDYQAVEQYEPIFTDDTKDTIKSRIKHLTNKINGIEQSYDALITEKNHITEKMNTLTLMMTELTKKHPTIDINKPFPFDGNRLLTRIEHGISKLNEKLSEMNENERRADQRLIKQQANVDNKIEQFENQYPHIDIVQFDKDLDEIEISLQERQRKLKSKESYLQNELMKVKQELTDIDNAKRQLERFQEAHYFNSELVQEIMLSQNEITNFAYERVKYVTEITKKLRSEQDNLQNKEDNIKREKSKFNTFCQRKITNRKLRETAINGLEQNNTLDDVLKYQQNMVARIESSDKYARETISHTDKEVQAFINSIHNHLSIVTDQLRIIPNNTKVTFDNKRLNVFHFTIPEWDVNEGKIKIRENIDWILQQLEADHFKDEQGIEDHGKVRKQIETWLDTRQLLHVVMGEKTMKVSCRKVTNDNKVSHRLTSWEQSNKWSGGEMWSKNMTLFLGILNFIAEKKSKTKLNTKRHRAVILDNPFGKASSSHVLGPVFYIAEQLGFQMIALTAHADGKFLQDYFPINYSLKLRSTADRTKQVMTKEKSLHHAYFQDHDPTTLSRLEDIEQMELL